MTRPRDMRVLEVREFARSVFRPQYRTMFGWKTFKRYVPAGRGMDAFHQCFHSLEEAQAFLEEKAFTATQKITRRPESRPARLALRRRASGRDRLVMSKNP